ncbi:uncharacterized protein [Chiloscyllium punctatum]|uniref:Transmembrane protein 53 n=1 Tax=Chiloscyllium punctatum TaxID=137246 RepID=A0A401RT22_CHIPU|nr:hypothetical protein [Chiloscyllium punctatum]
MIKRFSSTITLYGNSTKTLNGAPRPLLLFLPWYGAKCHAMDHYRQIYYPYGFDILSVESSILHFLWPQYGLSYASEVLDLLQSEPFSSRPLLIHASSIGGFLFAEMLIITQRDVPRYSSFGSRIMGQIFDSLVAGDVELLANGVKVCAHFQNLAQLSLFQFETNLNSDHVKLRTINGQLLAQVREWFTRMWDQKIRVQLDKSFNFSDQLDKSFNFSGGGSD